MLTIKKSKTCCWLAMLCLVMAPTIYAADGWTISPLVLPGDTIENKTIVNLLTRIDIDETGNVAFIADYTDDSFPDPANPGRGIFTQDRVVVVKGEVLGAGIYDVITDIEDHPRARPSIANNIVSYVATTPPNFTTLGVFKEKAWVVKPGDTLDADGDIAGRPFCCAPSINVFGTVAFNSGASNTPNPGPFNNYNTDQAIYTSPGGAVVRKYQSYEGHELTQVRETAIADTGDVVTKVSIVRPDDPTKSIGAIMLNQTFALLPGDPIGSTGYYLGPAVGIPAISDNGLIVFGGLLATTPDGSGPFSIFTSDRIVAKPGDIKDGIAIKWAGAQEINESGEVAYLALYGTFSDPLGALFLDEDLVAQSGDFANGIELTDVVRTGNIGLNNDRRIAFIASYNSAGETVNGLFLASPSNPDSDGDGVFDDVDLCPTEDATGFDSNGDGCIDNLTGLSDILDTLVNEEVIPVEMEGSLTSKVDNAMLSADKDNICAGINTLIAFKHQIEAQRGKKLSEEAADELIDYADTVILKLTSELPEGTSC